MEYFYKNISTATPLKNKNIRLHITKNETDVIKDTEARDDLAIRSPSEVLINNHVYNRCVSSICIYASTDLHEIIDAIATAIRFKKELLISGHPIDLIDMHPIFQEVYLTSQACKLDINSDELIEHAFKLLRKAVQTSSASIDFVKSFASTFFEISDDEINQRLRSVRLKENEAITLSLNFSEAKTVSCLNNIDLSLNRVTVISAETGTGKTTYVIDNYLRDLLKKDSNLRVAIIAHKNEINTNINYKISTLLPNAKEANHNTKSLRKLEEAQIIVSTTNSLPNMLQYVLGCDLVIFDESEKGFLSLDGNHYKNERLKAKSFNALKTVITYAKQVIMMDADSTNCITAELVKSTGIHDYQFYKVEGGKYSDININLVNRDTVLNAIRNEDNAYQVIAFDKKEALYQYLFSIGLKSSGKGCAEKALEAGYLVVTRDTCNTDAVRKYLATPNVSCFLYKQILYSPYIDSAVSIETNYTDKVLVISHSILTPKGLIQMGRRFRQAKEITYGIQTDNVIPYEYKNIDSSGKPINSSFTFEHMQHVIHHISTHTRHNMPVSLKRTATALGFRVNAEEYYAKQDANESLLQKQLEEVYRASVNESIYNAPEHVTDLDEANEVIQSGQANNLQLSAAEKRVISERLHIQIDYLTDDAISFSRNKASLLEHLQEYTEWRQTKTSDQPLFNLMNVLFKTLNISIERIDQKHSIPKSSYYEAYDIINQLLNGNSALCKKLSSMNTMLKPITSQSHSEGYKTRAINDFLSKLGFDTEVDHKTNGNYRKYNIWLNSHAYPSILNQHDYYETSLDIKQAIM
ncbi:TPA: DEAD/DEAH box helicase family protein [Vibrio parahaemolyticus]|uniref:DEAD/DEAH box helicase family protein n=1 Tax=Vibrio alginolyticus TaxID=663 RepID=UPI003755151C|nr:DEAD/DEAH box helicase family protein [Vibrio parahaemolyticus]HCG6657663.1 DEAD/DEAH box helicase family protein [Vibrio parahaemolyticus]